MNYQIPLQTIEEVQADLVKRFTHFSNPKDRYRYLIDMGKQLQQLDDSFLTEENRIHGCQSQVWIHIDEHEGRLFMQARSDAAIVSGLIALLLRVYNGRTPQEVATAPLEFLGKIGLLQQLSPNRSTGLYHMIKRIQSEGQKRLSA
ncbi:MULTISPECIES: SufE family protein [Thiomicrorhabdus]|uniref:SufE family protein n=1 Tax=Thiomicrorhabdus heinhorstiae TaxID=2748010 RepID=A0ABS0BTH9_9GAMM|nr:MULTISPECIES: SufE family protein [Thiomicrorhabdus]MBF6057146.1 SufE family protein [Thiomicrorhabdus heinhorstiae]